MRSGTNVTHLPYTPGGLRLRTSRTVRDRQSPPFFPQDMRLFKRFISEFIQTHQDPKYKAFESRVTTSSSNDKDTKRSRPSLTGRAMRFLNFRGDKRKRERDDGGFYRRKTRLVNEGIARAVTEEEMDRDELRCADLLDILYPTYVYRGIKLADFAQCLQEHMPEDTEDLPQSFWKLMPEEPPTLPKVFQELMLEDPEDCPESFEDLLSETSCTLDNLTIVDDDDTVTSTQRTSSKTSGEVDKSWLEGLPEWENKHRERRRHSDSSIEISLLTDTIISALPNDSGRKSVPPDLDATWSLAGTSPGGGSAVSDAEFLKEMFAASLELSEGGSKSEHGVEATGNVEEAKVQAGVEGQAEMDVEATEVEEAQVKEANLTVAVKAVIKVIAETKAVLHNIEVITLEEVETSTLEEPQVTNRPKPAPEPVSEPASSTPAPALELTIRTADSLTNRFAHIAKHQVEPRSDRRQINADEVARRIRAVRRVITEELLAIEQSLRPYCSGMQG
ncbi:hypothetical protein V8C42DRAFT_342389 [Trichoderma barbatum]